MRKRVDLAASLIAVACLTLAAPSSADEVAAAAPTLVRKAIVVDLSAAASARSTPLPAAPAASESIAPMSVGLPRIVASAAVASPSAGRARDVTLVHPHGDASPTTAPTPRTLRRMNAVQVIASTAVSFRECADQHSAIRVSSALLELTVTPRGAVAKVTPSAVTSMRPELVQCIVDVAAALRFGPPGVLVRVVVPVTAAPARPDADEARPSETARADAAPAPEEKSGTTETH